MTLLPIICRATLRPKSGIGYCAWQIEKHSHNRQTWGKLIGREQLVKHYLSITANNTPATGATPVENANIQEGKLFVYSPTKRG